MKALYQSTTPLNSTDVVFCETLHGDQVNTPWHFHEEMEITLLLSGEFQRSAGDNISSVTAGSLTLLGSQLPHCFATQGNSKNHSAIQVRFNPTLLGSWMQMSDVLPLQELFRRASLGLEVRGQTKTAVSEIMSRMSNTTGLQRLILLLEILNLLCASQECVAISSPGYALEIPSVDRERLSRISKFIRKKMGDSLYLKDVARHVGMSPVSLSRYLRTHLRKTFPTYLNELRIARVCRLLKETDATISEIAMHCGFDSMANFERQFRKIQRCSPKVYRQRAIRLVPMPQKPMDRPARAEAPVWKAHPRNEALVALRATA